ncbi:MAG TPA: DUF2231 domain-containing protein [Chitinophagales bacterium]|nr:DUF2231 domain-containing protein [Chitinophagales bacterium]
MNPAHLHLLTNHFPIVGIAFGIIVLIAGLLFKKDDFKNAAYGIFILTALLAVPAYLSGEPAEEAVENLPGITEALIETHEEIATVAIWLVELLGVLALAVLIYTIKGKPVQRIGGVVTLLFSMAVFGVMVKVGNSGGEIRHPEVRRNQGTVLQENVNGNVTEQEKDED